MDAEDSTLSCPRERDARRHTRREFITGAATLIASATTLRAGTAQPPAIIHTVTGPVAADRLGLTLMHEHVLVDFIGAEHVSPSRYDADLAFKVILPHLAQLKSFGCETLVECTPAYLGRDVVLLQRLSTASGVNIVTNTGYYGAAKDKHLPPHAFTETAEQLAARWIRESENGIDGTAIKPAFMKIGVDGAPLSDVDAKLVQAAALTSRATGLPIASHTTSGAAAIAEIEILDRAKVPASSFIWVHAHNERDSSFHVRAAKAGAWVEFDGVSETSVGRHVELVVTMKAQGLLEHVLVAHDAGWFRVGEPNGGAFRPFDTVFTKLIPALGQAGVTSEEIRRLLVANPARALTSRRERTAL
jgi:phosphotriesterase-related protein